MTKLTGKQEALLNELLEGVKRRDPDAMKAQEGLMNHCITPFRRAYALRGRMPVSTGIRQPLYFVARMPAVAACICGMVGCVAMCAETRTAFLEKEETK